MNTLVAYAVLVLMVAGWALFARQWRLTQAYFRVAEHNGNIAIKLGKRLDALLPIEVEVDMGRDTSATPAEQWEQADQAANAAAADPGSCEREWSRAQVDRALEEARECAEAHCLDDCICDYCLDMVKRREAEQITQDVRAHTTGPDRG